MSKEMSVRPGELSQHESPSTKILIDNRPSDYEYALLSLHVYRGRTIKKENCLPGHKDWIIHQVSEEKSGYFGAIYINNEIKQVVLAHRGTDSLKAILEDIRGIYFNKISPQKNEAYTFMADAINLVRSKPDYHLSFTGHSLGAFLAELSVFYVHSNESLGNVNAVTFESPGSKESMEKMQSNLKPIILEQMDIVGYVSYPNLINTCNKHVGTLYQIEPDLGHRGWAPGWHTKKAHSLKRIIHLFEKDVNHEPLRHYMSDWPLGSQTSIYFELTNFQKGYYSIEKPMEQQENLLERDFKLNYKGHYTKEPSGSNSMPLRHFSSSFQSFLKDFYRGISALDQNMHKLLKERWTEILIPEKVIQYLQSYRVEADSSGTKKIVLEVKNLKNAKVHDFRYELSKWLSNCSHNIFGLLNLPQDINKLSPSSVEVRAEIIAPGGKLEKDGIIINAKSTGTHVDIPEGASEKDIHNLIQLSQPVLNKINKIDASIIAPDAICNGLIKNATATGFLCTMSPRKEQTNKRREDNCSWPVLITGERAEYFEQKAKSITKNKMTQSLVKENIHTIKVAAIEGTDHIVMADKIEVTGVKVTQM